MHLDLYVLGLVLACVPRISPLAFRRLQVDHNLFLGINTVHLTVDVSCNDMEGVVRKIISADSELAVLICRDGIVPVVPRTADLDATDIRVSLPAILAVSSIRTSVFSRCLVL